MFHSKGLILTNLPIPDTSFSGAWKQEVGGWEPGISFYGLESSQDPDAGLLLLFLAGANGRICRQVLVDKQDQMSSSAPTAQLPRTQDSAPCSPAVFPQGHHPSKTKAAIRLPGHSCQLFSHPSRPTCSNLPANLRRPSGSPLHLDLGTAVSSGKLEPPAWQVAQGVA